MLVFVKKKTYNQIYFLLTPQPIIDISVMLRISCSFFFLSLSQPTLLFITSIFLLILVWFFQYFHKKMATINKYHRIINIWTIFVFITFLSFVEKRQMGPVPFERRKRWTLKFELLLSRYVHNHRSHVAPSHLSGSSIRLIIFLTPQLPWNDDSKNRVWFLLFLRLCYYYP